MSKKFFAAQKTAQGKFDYGHLKSGYHLNVGNNVVTILPDLSFAKFLTTQNRKLVSKIVLKPGEFAWLDNTCIVVESDDKRPINLMPAENQDELQKRIEYYKAGRVAIDTNGKFIRNDVN